MEQQRADYTADFMSDPEHIILTCKICDDVEKISTVGVATTGLLAGQKVQLDPVFVDKQIRKWRKLHEKAHG